MRTFPAITHVAVTVTDLSVSVPWYSQLFAVDAVLDEDTGPFRHVVFAIGGGMLFGLHTFPDGDWSSGFDPRRPGLDHVAFTCADRMELQRWQERLEELGIKHGGIVDAHYGSGLSFKESRRHRARVLRPTGVIRSGDPRPLLRRDLPERESGRSRRPNRRPANTAWLLQATPPPFMMTAPWEPSGVRSS